MKGEGVRGNSGEVRLRRGPKEQTTPGYESQLCAKGEFYLFLTFMSLFPRAGVLVFNPTFLCLFGKIVFSIKTFQINLNLSRVSAFRMFIKP